MPADCSDIDQSYANFASTTGQMVQVQNQTPVLTQAALMAIWLLVDIAKSLRRMAVAEEAMIAAPAAAPVPQGPQAAPAT